MAVKLTQQIVFEMNRERFIATVNNALRCGWRVVPATFAIQNVESVVTPDYQAHRTANGTAFFSRFFIVLETDAEEFQPIAIINTFQDTPPAPAEDLTFVPMRGARVGNDRR